jgi:hypothetical protein
MVVSRFGRREPPHYIDLAHTLRQLRTLRERVSAATGYPQADQPRRRAEDHIREAYHDARARTIGRPLPEARSKSNGRPPLISAGSADRVRVRLVKAPPAPLVDGFDMRGLRAGHLYDTPVRLARYLVIAGYAVVTPERLEREGTAADRAAAPSRQTRHRRARRS